jgi:hypothetical protein
MNRRSLLTALAMSPLVLAQGGSRMTSPFAQAIASQAQPSASMRIGRVTSFDSGYITVAISGTTVLAQASYVIGSYFPTAGDHVFVVNQGSQWVVVGELSANPAENAVANHSFEQINPAGTYASNWTEYIPAGQSVNMATGVSSVWGNMLDGQYAGYVQALFINDASLQATGDAYILSDLFPVAAGERWSLSGWVTVSAGASYEFAETHADITMYVYANATDTFPTGTVIGNTSATDPMLISESLWMRINNSFPGEWDGFTIPSGGNYAQIVCHGSCARRTFGLAGFVQGAVTIYFDRIQAVRL